MLFWVVHFTFPVSLSRSCPAFLFLPIKKAGFNARLSYLIMFVTHTSELGLWIQLRAPCAIAIMITTGILFTFALCYPIVHSCNSVRCFFRDNYIFWPARYLTCWKLAWNACRCTARDRDQKDENRQFFHFSPFIHHLSMKGVPFTKFTKRALK